MAATSPAILARRRAAARRRFWTRMAWAGVFLVVLALAVGLAFAGSADRLGGGTRVAGVDVSGLSPAAARRELAQRWQRTAATPVAFTFGSRRFLLSARELGVRVDWASAVAAARRQGDGFGFVRGYRRLGLKLFPADVTPRARASDAALAYELGLIGRVTDRPSRDAQLVRRGLHFEVVRGESGRLLDRTAAASVILASLSSFDRSPAALPVDVSPPDVTAASLAAAQRSATVAVSAPVTLAIGPTRIKLPRWRIATLLDLTHATGGLQLGGQGATAELRRLQQAVNRAPRDADWAVGAGGSVRVVPAQPGLALDVRKSMAAILAAAERPANRVARLVLLGGAAEPVDCRGGGARDHGDGRRIRDLLRRRAQPDPQCPARGPPGRSEADRSRRDVLVQQDDRRPLRRPRLPRSPCDHQRRGSDRSRGRRLPGLDHGLQRRVRRRVADHRPHEPRALHLALPPRSRCDRRLPRRRPEVRQRHRSLAAAAHVGQLVLADGRAVRDVLCTAASSR